jgi:hypothetical protein
VATADEVVNQLIARFERLSPRGRLAQADTVRTQLEQLDLADRVKDRLWAEVFTPLVARAEREAAEQAEAVRANAGAVVLKGVVDVVGRHPRKLDRETCAEVLTGGRTGVKDPAYGVAAGVPAPAVLKVLDQLVAKGLLAESGGRLERIKRPTAV